MSEFHRVTERFSVAPQLAPEDMAAAAQQGFVRVVCNRPDSEGPGQPSGGAIKAAAQAAGLEFLHIPFAGMPDASTADAVFTAVSEAPGPVRECDVRCEGGAISGTVSVVFGGPRPVLARDMTLRDWFAGQALVGFLSGQNQGTTFETDARDAYRVADAFIAAREAKSDA